MGTSYPVGGFRYLPRQDGSSNGRIAGYRFYVSANGVNWGTPVAQGTFANNSTEKTVTFGAAPPN
jgi:F5/8 type C domain-containing protein